MERVEDRLMLSATFNVPNSLNLAQAVTEGGFIDFDSAGYQSSGTFYSSSDSIRISCAAEGVQGELFDRAASTSGTNYVKPITLVPGEVWPVADQGGMIDVTPVINERVSVAQPLPTTTGPSWKAHIASLLDPAEVAKSADSTEVALPPITLDGARGRSQAFELAMLPESGLPIEAIEHRAKRASSSVLPMQQSARVESPAKPAHMEVSVEIPTPAEPLDGKLGFVSPSIHDEHAGPDSIAQADPTGTSISGHHEAVFAQMAEPSDHATASAVSIDNNRQADLIPLLAVAIVAGQMLKRQSHTRDDGRTCLIPPRRRDKPTGKPA
jgi:hypothetical protein